MMQKINYFFKMAGEVFHDRIFIFLTLANLALLFLIWFFWLTKITPSGYQIYSQFKLSEQKETAANLPPLIASAIFIINLILAAFSRRREALASYLLVGSSIFILALVLVLVRHYLSLI